MTRTSLQATSAFYNASRLTRIFRWGLGASQQLWPALAVRAALRLFGTPLPPKWLNRRSQRKSFTVRSFVAAWERWQMPDPQVNETPWPRTARQHQPRLV